ncbi:MAG: DUF4115 domain-containing protein [Anaerolineales bacterium]|nr:DUF4115 domain-containing protein [Anaerolineales bacterium]
MLTIGQRLKQEREARYISIERASEETRIRAVFLKALEADDYSALPSAAQGRGFLRNYAEYLDIKIDEALAEIQRSAPPIDEVSGPLPQVNLAETDLPAFTETTEAEVAPPFWKRRLSAARAWFAKPKPESTPTDPTLQAILDAEKDTALEAPVEAEPDSAESAARGNFLQNILQRFTSKPEKAEPAVPESNPQAEVSQPTQPALPADVIFKALGQQLRERRELISLTLEEVERHTKLKAVFIKALEAGAMNQLPSTVQTRGMLTNYATFLDLDTDALLLQFADALQARRREKYAETPREKIQTEVKASLPFFRAFLAGDLLIGLTMIVLLIALGAWGIGYAISSQSKKAAPTSASIVDVLVDTDLNTLTPEGFAPVNDPELATNAAAVTATLAEQPTVSLDANVVVSVFSVERAFVRIAVDDEVVFEGRIAPFETHQYSATEKIEILCGNAAALKITYNGKDLGLMGNVGEVVNRVYTISGVIAPTATPTPTATNTPLVTNTLTPTVTPTPTSVATPTP